MLKRKGISTDFIKEALGHSNTSVTENYLDSFADEVKLENSKLLTSYSK
jgi:integrase